jgi:hypothetical protein
VSISSDELDAQGQIFDEAQADTIDEIEAGRRI